MKRKRLFSIVFAVLFLFVFVFSSSCVYADKWDTAADPSNGGPSGGGGNNNSGGGGTNNGGNWSKCVNYCTSLGASWRYYPWDGNRTILTNGDSGRTEGTETPFAKNYTFPDEAVSVCEQAKGYYRYGFVRMSDGKQNGIVRTNGNESTWVNSVYFGGQTNYSTTFEGDMDWEYVHQVYLAMGFSESQWASGVSLFCASEGPPPPPTNPTCPAAVNPAGYTASGETNGWSSVRTQLQRNNGGYTGFAYAKPTDFVHWQHCYFAGMQKVADSKATTRHNEPKKIQSSSDTVHNNTNTLMKDFNDWVNGFNVIDIGGGNGLDHNYAYGDSNIQRIDHSYTVDQSWVGRTFSEASSLIGNPWHASVTKQAAHTWTCSYEYEIGCWETKTKWVHFLGYSDYECTDGSSLVQQGGNYYCSSGATPTRKPITEECQSGNPKKPCNYSIEEKVWNDHCKKTMEKTCSHGNDYITYSKDKNMHSGDLSSETASIQVPYNFNLSGTISLDGDVVYAGETAKLKTGSVKVEDRTNNTTGGTYSTRAPGVKVKVLTFVWDTPVDSVPNGAVVRGANDSEIIEVGELADGEERSLKNNLGGSVNVDDTTAGKYFCVAIQVYPRSSGGDTSMDPSQFDNTFKSSGADCKKIAKRPSFQIWGGSLYSNGKIDLTRAKKNNLFGDASRPYKISGVNDANVFGSWGEYGILSIKTNKGLASATTLAGDKGRYETTPNDGFCKFESLLTFANYAKGLPICNGSNITDTAGQFGGNTLTVDKKSLLNDVFVYDETVNFKGTASRLDLTVGTQGTYTQFMSANGKLINYTYSGNKGININASTVQRSATAEGQVSTTYIVRTNGDIAINGDVQYADGYSKLEDMPKLIIYAKNIYINCQVNRVDAVLIAEQNVDTCAEWNGTNPDLNSEARSRLLKINGTVITNKLLLNRTYGAGKGTASGVPAEIINYDTTLLLWGRAQADTSDSGRTTTTYIRELAPRY